MSRRGSAASLLAIPRLGQRYDYLLHLRQCAWRPSTPARLGCVPDIVMKGVRPGQPGRTRGSPAFVNAGLRPGNNFRKERLNAMCQSVEVLVYEVDVSLLLSEMTELVERHLEPYLLECFTRMKQQLENRPKEDEI